MNSDSGFVLILTLSKMVEATNLKTVEEVISQVQNIKVVDEVKTAPVEVTSTPVAQQVEQEIPTPSTIEPQVTVAPTIEKEDKSVSLFKKLIANIYEKSYDLGECFETSFTFASYENNILKINSTANGECKSKLFKNFSHIKNFIEEVYGSSTELEFEKIEKEPAKELARVVQPSTSAKQIVEHREEIPANDNFVGSMIEDIELQDQPSSCVAGMSEMTNPNLAQKEINIDEVLNSKMVNTAMKLFQSPNAPRVKSKL